MDCSYLTGLKREVTKKRYILLRTARTAPPTPVPTRLLSNLDNNSERPVDALAEKHQLLTDSLESRDASASKNANIVNCNQIVAKGL